MFMDSGRGLEVIARLLLLAARREIEVVKLLAPAATVYGVLLISTVVAEVKALVNVRSKV